MHVWGRDLIQISENATKKIRSLWSVITSCLSKTWVNVKTISFRGTKNMGSGVWLVAGAPLVHVKTYFGSDPDGGGCTFGTC